ncbi:MAG: rod shape-determining protein MreC [Minisyncoccia bacterium]
MKTLYHQKNRIRSIYRNKVIFILSLFFVCAVFFSFLDGGVIRTVTPAWLAENFVVQGFSNFFNLVHSKQFLINENNTLRARIASDELALSAYGGLENQNNLLLETYGRGQRNNYIAATVLVRPPKTIFDSIIVDAGSNQNVRVDNLVLVPEGAVIGIVSEVFSNNARVKLFSTSGEETPAILERGNVSIDLRGMGGGTFEASVPRITEVVVGDRILSAHIHGALLGVVEDVEMSPTDSFKRVLIRSVVNIFNIHFVSISNE